MRMRPVITLLLSVLTVTVMADDVVMIPLTPNDAIIDHIRSIKGPERMTEIRITRPDGILSKRMKVRVFGPIKPEDVSTIVNSALAPAKDFWIGGNWTINVSGDDRYAQVYVGMYCGALCGFSSTYAYERQDGRWVYLYTSDTLIS
jgi:hypothetical protein